VARAEDTECIVMGTADLPLGSLQALDVLHQVPADRFVKDLDEARDLAKRLLSADT